MNNSRSDHPLITYEKHKAWLDKVNQEAGRIVVEVGGHIHYRRNQTPTKTPKP